MSYKEDPKFIELKITFEQMSDKVDHLRKAASCPRNDGNIIVLDNLIISIVEFDSHVKLMMDLYPDYYSECKTTIDRLLASNLDFIQAINNKKLGIISYGSN